MVNINSKSINIGLVGCGRISHKHILATEAIEGTKIVAVCDIDKNRAEDTANKLKINRVYTDFKDILKDEQVDVVDICAPSGLHRRMAVDALKMGKDVLLEKPISLTERDAKKVIRAVKKYNKILLNVVQNRFNPAIIFLKENMQILGKINYIEAACFWYRTQDYYNDGWHGKRNMDGGVLMSQGIHYIDMICYLLGSQPKEVVAFGGAYKHIMECEDVAVATIKFQNNVIASIRANTISYPENFDGSITIFFDKATIKIGGKAMNQIISWKGEGEDISKKFGNNDSDDIYGGGHFYVIKNLLDIKNSVAEPYIKSEECIMPVKIIEAAYKSMRKHKVIKL